MSTEWTAADDGIDQQSQSQRMNVTQLAYWLDNKCESSVCVCVCVLRKKQQQQHS